MKHKRNKMVAGNWKMNKTFQEAEDLISALADELDDMTLHDTEVVICPPFPYLEMATDIAEESVFTVGAQNLYPEDSGAYTGEISPVMLRSLGVTWCIVGHSERRKYFGENHAFLARKVQAAIAHGIRPLFCCGEVLEERRAENHFEVVGNQLAESLFVLPETLFSRVVVAYEPVWAIGTGVNATPDQAQEMHAFIRGLVRKKFGDEAGDRLLILYGGSCNAKNAGELFRQPDVDGGLIGGASLDPGEFLHVVRAAI